MQELSDQENITVGMSDMRLEKKLQPAKKAMKSFSNKVQSKAKKLNIPKPIKATFKRLLATLDSLNRLIPSRSGSRTLTRRRPHAAASAYNISAIRIEELSAEPACSVHVHANKTQYQHHHRAQEETTRGKEVIEEKDLVTIEDAWKALVEKTPHLQVDQKAEEFIYKFRQDMRLQNERSLQEFQQMLARGS